MADTHVDRENHPPSSPFAVNALSNARTRCCVADINRLPEEMGQLAPRFVLHLGDLIHPVPSMPAYAQAADDFHRIVAELKLPLYVLPGNHDVGDKPVEWAPAGVVREEFLAKWEEHFGHQYQSFSQQGVHFILLNAQVINSGLQLESEQREWLKMTLKDHRNERIFLFLHYPPYLCFPDEGEHYDNLAEPGRSWILNLIEQYQVEALFAGHVHHFWYHRFALTDCYLLPSTSFTRQDYSDLFRRPPTPEMQDGRNDTDKIGYFIVLIYEHGHVCHFRRTGVGMPKPHDLRPENPVSRVAPFHPREVTRCPVGFDMRHPWAELIDIAPSGALDEFHRKRVRNDYPLLALWEMGVGLTRIPAQEMDDPMITDRMRILRESGHQFVVISQGIPSPGICACMIKYQNLIQRWEVTLPLSAVQNHFGVIQTLKKEGEFPVYLSKLSMKSDFVRDGEPYFHQIRHGFRMGDQSAIEGLVLDSDMHKVFDGLVFRINRSDPVSESIVKMSTLSRQLGIKTSITMFMADPNPARQRCNDLDNVHYIAEGVFSCWGLDNTELFIDTFQDMDRGHCVRNGVIDRLCKPRPSMFVVRYLCALLSSVSDDCLFTGRGVTNNGHWISLRDKSTLYLLVLTDAPSNKTILHGLDHVTTQDKSIEVVDLATGVISSGTFRNCVTGGALMMNMEVSGAHVVKIPFE